MLSIGPTGVPYIMVLSQACQWKPGIAQQGYPAGIYLLKVNNKNTRARCEIC